MVRLTVHASRKLTIAFLAVHGATAALTWPLQTVVVVKLVVWCFMAASLAHALARHALLRTKNAIVVVVLRDSVDATVVLRDGSSWKAQVLGTTYVSAELTVLHLRVDGFRFAQHVLLVRDNVHVNDYRRLRVLLRWSRRGDTPRLAATSTDASVP